MRIEKLEARGAYHVIVKGGSYFVDGILASDYDGAVSRAVWPLVHAYVGARLWLHLAGGLGSAHVPRVQVVLALVHGSAEDELDFVARDEISAAARGPDGHIYCTSASLCFCPRMQFKALQWPQEMQRTVNQC